MHFVNVHHRKMSSDTRRAIARAGTIYVSPATMPRRVSRSRTKALRAKRATATPALHALMAAGNAAVQHRKGQFGGTGLEAPMTGDIEHQLERLIRKVGYRRVRDALASLVTKCKWNDWLCVANAVDRLARKVRKHRSR